MRDVRAVHPVTAPAAQEVIRRAERGLGLAIRKGQAEGTILRQGQTGYRPGHHMGDPDKVAPRSVADLGVSSNELHGNSGSAGIYAMTDGVSDEEFDAAIDAAKARGTIATKGQRPGVLHGEKNSPNGYFATEERIRTQGQGSRDQRVGNPEKLSPTDLEYVEHVS
jgi:hypothetical protein